MNQKVDFDPRGALECMEVLRPHHKEHFAFISTPRLSWVRLGFYGAVTEGLRDTSWLCLIFMWDRSKNPAERS